MVIVTEWVQYRALDLDRIKSEMAQPVVVDLRNIYRPRTWRPTALRMTASGGRLTVTHSSFSPCRKAGYPVCAVFVDRPSPSLR
jgi:hypothetical protein